MKHATRTLLMLLIVVVSSKPNTPGIVPFAIGTFNNASNEIVMAYADLNLDQKLDIVTKTSASVETPDQLNIYLWNQQLQIFLLAASTPIMFAELHSVIACSLYSPANLVLYLVVPNQVPTPQGNIVVYSVTCTEATVCTFDTSSKVQQLLAVDSVEPALIVLQGVTTLLFSKSNVASVAIFTSSSDYKIDTLASFVDGGSLGSYRTAYFGDFSGDCVSDLILLVDNGLISQLQFIRGKPNGLFAMVGTATLGVSVQHFTLNDINFNGYYDLILLLANGTIQIHYNTIVAPLQAALCVPVPADRIPFDFVIAEGSISQIQQISWPMATHSSAKLLFGDFNRDSYDDLTLTLMQSTSTPKALLYLNIPCVNEGCGTFNPAYLQQSSTRNLRSFTQQSIPTITGQSLKMSFFDFYDDGKLDLLVNVAQTDSLGNTYFRVQPVYNNIAYDTFFMQVRVLAGSNRQLFYKNPIVVGASVSFYVTLLTGSLAPKVITQISQAGSALQLPTLVTGLGRTNNYVQSFTVTVPSTMLLQKSWNQIVPNSEILVLPGTIVLNKAQQSASQSSNSGWILQLMIEPTQRMGFVIFLVIVTLILLGLWILRLTAREKEEDKETIDNFYAILR